MAQKAMFSFVPWSKLKAHYFFDDLIVPIKKGKVFENSNVVNNGSPLLAFDTVLDQW